MKLQFLGTSAGTPTKTRNVTALALSYAQRSNWYLIDCGEATQHQLQKSCFSLSRLTHIFITHLHGDHIFGLPGLLTSRSMAGSPKNPITIYGPQGIKEFIEATLRLSASHITYPLEIREFTKAGMLYENKYETVTAVRLSHDVPSFAYVFKEAVRPGIFDIDRARAAGVPAGPLLGQLHMGKSITLEDGTELNGTDFIGSARSGRTVIIGGDNDEPSLLAPYLKEADLFVHEATLTIPVKENLSFKSRHSTAASVAITADKSEVKNLILTHISPRYGVEETQKGLSISDIKAEAGRFYKGPLFIAHDLDIYHLDRDGGLTQT